MDKPTDADLERDAERDYGLLVTSDPADRTAARLAWIRRAVAAAAERDRLAARVQALEDALRLLTAWMHG